MNADELPDDLAAWPADDESLFGLGPEPSLADLKRAYAARIKRFKPERHPAHFQRLREAFERMRRDAAWRDRWARSEPLPSSDAESSAADSEDAAEGALPAKPAPAFTPYDPLVEIWELAVAGDRAGAYARLQRFEREDPGLEGACIRLYWLLVADPALEPGRKPLTWLLVGLPRAGLQGPLMSALREELVLDPAVADSPSLSALFKVEASRDALASLAVCRWQAFARHRRRGFADRVRRDLDVLRERVETDGSAESWRAWIAVCEAAILSMDGVGRLLVQQSFKAFDAQPLDRNADYWASQGDRIRGFYFDDYDPAADEDSLRAATLLRIGDWSIEREMLRDEAAIGAFHFAAFLERMDRRRTRWKWLPETMADRLWSEDDDDEIPAEISQAALARVSKLPRYDYEKARLPLLEICIDLDLSPAALARILRGRAALADLSASALAIRALAPGLADDHSLRAVWAAHRLFWSEAAAAPHPDYLPLLGESSDEPGA